MIRRRGSVWLFALAVAGFACPVWAQSDSEPATPDVETTTEGAGATREVDLSAAPSRQEWVILTAILGEQLPSTATLAELRLNDDGSVSVEVIAEIQTDLIAPLVPFFSSVLPEPPRIVTPERSAVRLQGIPQSLNAYRALKGEEPAEQDSAPTAGNPSPGPSAQSSDEVWPPLRVRRLFNQDQIRMVQLTLDGRDYIVREGSLFSNNAYRFIGMAVGEDGQPSETCVLVERVASATRRTLCSEE